MDAHRPTDGTTASQRGLGHGRGRTIAAVVVTLLVCGATTAVAAKLITGNDIKNGSIPRGRPEE